MLVVLYDCHCCGASNFLAEAVQRSGDVLLAYEMNGRCGLVQARACRTLLLKVQGRQLRFQGAYGLHMHSHSALWVAGKQRHD